jgi:cell shape-determining protein MreC
MPHVSVYVDESGDVGFNEKSSKFFTIGYVFTINHFPSDENKKVKRLLKNINSRTRNHKKKISEFKFSCNTETTRKRFLRQIRQLDVNIGVVCVSKDSVKQHLKEDSSLFYRYVVIENVITVLVDEYLKTFDPYNRIRFEIKCKRVYL